MKRVTLSDVSEAAGVSRSTVSLVVNDSPSIPESTKTRIRHVMADLGYVYNRGAATLRGTRTKAVGVIATEMANGYFAELIMAFEETISGEGFTLLVGYSRDDGARESRILRTFIEQGVDGIVLLPTTGSDLSQLADISRTMDLPILSIAKAQNSEIGFVTADNLQGGQMLGRHLSELGTTDVAFVGGLADNSTVMDRVHGITTGLAATGRTVRTVSSPVTPQGGAAGTAELLEAGHFPDAIVALSDVIATGIYAELHSRGLRPGYDVAVASFDDTPSATHQVPPLTSVATFPQIIGGRCADLLLQSILPAARKNDWKPAETREFIQPQLRIRASSVQWRRR